MIRPKSISEGWLSTKEIELSPKEIVENTLAQGVLRNRLLITVTKDEEFLVRDLGPIEGDNKLNCQQEISPVIDDQTFFYISQIGKGRRIIAYDFSKNIYLSRKSLDY